MDKDIVRMFTSMWNLKNKTNKTRLIDKEDRSVVIRWEGCLEVRKMGEGGQLYGW